MFVLLCLKAYIKKLMPFWLSFYSLSNHDQNLLICIKIKELKVIVFSLIRLLKHTRAFACSEVCPMKTRLLCYGFSAYLSKSKISKANDLLAANLPLLFFSLFLMSTSISILHQNIYQGTSCC
jgi:hypothetical protein